jgi:hypothetical protein
VTIGRVGLAIVEIWVSATISIGSMTAYLNMGISWHDGVHLFLSSVGHDKDQILEVFPNLLNFLHLRKNLISHQKRP